MSAKADNKQSSLKRRIRQFYSLLNAGEFERCYRTIDPRLLEKSGTVTVLQYANALRDFLDAVGTIDVQTVRINGLHLGEPSKLYEGRDFALGKTIWIDSAGEQHEFSERWVCEGSIWYTRSTGFLKPTLPHIPEQDTKSKSRTRAK